MPSWPVAAPTVLGSNCTFNVALWPGFNVSGNVAPTIVKPEPDNVAEVMETGRLPDEVTVIDCVIGAFTAVVPNAIPVELIVSADPLGVSCKANVVELPAAEAVSVAASAVPTVEILALKCAAVAPAGTVTVAGRLTAPTLLAKLTTRPPAAAATLSVTVQGSVPEPAIVVRLQDSAVIAGDPVPLTAMSMGAAMLLLISAEI